MQTFLPYPDFIQSAKCLDYKRLGKQRVESKQILDILNGDSKSNAWKNHPAVLMWKGYEHELQVYHDIMICEWIYRGYKNNMKLFNEAICDYYESYHKDKLFINYYTECDQRIDEYRQKRRFPLDTFHYRIPKWITNEFCSYHRATLLYKNPEWYSQFGWTEEPKYEYLWSTKKLVVTGEIQIASRMTKNRPY
jgi:hypothetical protein